MAKRTPKGRLAPFVPLLKDTLDSQAWRHTSFGARWLYVALKRRVPPQRNLAYLSHRNAAKDLGVSYRYMAQWFRELEHYGFIELERHGSLGVDGKGKAPRWRLTELGATSKASAGGLFEPPTNDFHKWDGVLFERPRDTRYRLAKTKPRHRRCNHTVTGGDDTSVTAPVTPTPASVTGGDDIGSDPSVTGGDDITRLTTGVARAGLREGPTGGSEEPGRGQEGDQSRAAEVCRARDGKGCPCCQPQRHGLDWRRS